MSLQKESYDSFKSKRTLLNLTFQKSHPSKRVFLFYRQISMFWTLFKEGIFFLSLNLNPWTPSKENHFPSQTLNAIHTFHREFFFLKLSMVMHPCRIHQISKNLLAMCPLKDFQNLQFWFSFNRYVHAMQSDMKCYLKVKLIIFLRYT